MRKVLLMISLLTAFDVYAACDEEGYFDCGTTGDVKWYLSNDHKTLSISGNGAMGDYEYVKTVIDGKTYNFTTAPWTDYTFEVENVVVGKGVTSVGSSAFATFQNVTSVNLADTITTIGDHAFRNMSKLENIELPSSLVTIDDAAFISCTHLKTIIVPNSVETIGEQAFYNAKRLESVIIPSSVTSIGLHAFGVGDRRIAGTVYCEQPLEGTSPCNSTDLGLPKSRFAYYTKDNNGNIIVNGQKYSSLEKLAKGQYVRRIYTVEEAEAVAGKTNRVTIKYR